MPRQIVIERSYAPHVVTTGEAAYTALCGCFRSDGPREWLNNTYPRCSYYHTGQLRWLYAVVFSTAGVVRHGVHVSLVSLSRDNSEVQLVLASGVQGLNQYVQWRGRMDYGYGVGLVIPTDGVNDGDLLAVHWGVERELKS